MIPKDYERIKLFISKVTRDGRVYVHLKPQANLKSLPYKLNNMTVNFYMEPFDTDVNIKKINAK